MTPDPGLKAQTIQTVSGKEQIRDQDKVQLFLSYFGIFALIPLLTVKDSNFVQWHAKQGLALCVSWLVAGIALWIVGIVLHFIPVLGMIVGCLAGPLLGLAFLGADIYAMIKAFGGERWEIPLVSNVAKMF